MTKYQHYKGGMYTLLHIATHSETGEQLVVYQNTEGKVWIRPHDMFFEDVVVDGDRVPRFREIKEYTKDREDGDWSLDWEDAISESRKMLPVKEIL